MSGTKWCYGESDKNSFVSCSQAKMCLLHPPQDDLSGSDLPDAGLDDVEIHQLPVEKVEGAQPDPGLKEEGGQPEEQASQKGTYKG